MVVVEMGPFWNKKRMSSKGILGKKKIERKKGKGEENLVGRLIMWGEEVFFIEKKKKQRGTR